MRLCGVIIFSLVSNKENLTAQKSQSRVNKQIDAKNVLLIDEDGKQLGVVPIEEALGLATDKNLDLVEVAPNGIPVVCKLLNLGRHNYVEKKKRTVARNKQRQTTTKMVKFRPNTFKGDYDVKLQKIRRFLVLGDKVKVVMQFKGREIIHLQHGFTLFNRISEEIAGEGGDGLVDSKPAAEGRFIHMMLSPVPRGKRSKVTDNINGE